MMDLQPTRAAAHAPVLIAFQRFLSPRSVGVTPEDFAPVRKDLNAGSLSLDCTATLTLNA